VAGYPVEEWAYETDNGSLSVWVTNKLGLGFLRPAGARSTMELPAELRAAGLALRITSQGKFKMEAKKVSPGAPDPSLFTVPDGYTAMGGATGAPDASASGAPAGASAMPADAQAQMQKAMENMTPDQKAMMMKAMQNQGGAGY
jgi:hypothetical protein